MECCYDGNQALTWGQSVTYLVVVTNLTRSHPGSQVGDHAVSAAGFLTGVWPKRTEAAPTAVA